MARKVFPAKGAKGKLALLLAAALLSFPGGSALSQEDQAGESTLPVSPAAVARQTLPPAARNEGRKTFGKQQRDLLKLRFEKMKSDADELAGLAKSLQEDLDASNENVLSVKVVDKAKRIEKLAKKIKSAARGF